MFLAPYILTNGPNPASFFGYFLPCLIPIISIQIEKSVDGVLGILTMGIDETKEPLWSPLPVFVVSSSFATFHHYFVTWVALSQTFLLHDLRLLSIYDSINFCRPIQGFHWLKYTTVDFVPATLQYTKRPHIPRKGLMVMLLYDLVNCLAIFYFK